MSRRDIELKVTLIVKDSFSAAHFIKGHRKCGRTHGHTYNVSVEFEGELPWAHNMLIDFSRLGGFLEYAVKPLDHQLLNEILPFSPTAELLARHIFNRIMEKIEHDGIKKVWVKQVTVWETEKYGASYGGEEE